MDNIFRVNKSSGLVDEFYFVGMAKDVNYAIFANISGHLPERVYLVSFAFEPVAGHGWFSSKDEATDHAINSAKHLIELLNKK